MRLTQLVVVGFATTVSLMFVSCERDLWSSLVMHRIEASRATSIFKASYPRPS
jgi:hypothetical protein